MKHAIHFILTGGTIDSYFEPVVATTIPNSQSIIPSYFKDMIKPHAAVSFETLCMKDSKDLTAADKDGIVTAIHKAPCNNIIIAHGTDTMVETMNFLIEAGLQAAGKIIILTGSFIPLQHFALSDAGFNLGFAMRAAQTLQPGLYICMNGEVFEAGHVKKDKPNARFIRH